MVQGENVRGRGNEMERDGATVRKRVESDCEERSETMRVGGAEGWIGRLVVEGGTIMSGAREGDRDKKGGEWEENGVAGFRKREGEGRRRGWKRWKSRRRETEAG